jgi:hypothetical protein
VTQTPDPRDRRDNGLAATSFVPLAEVDAALGDLLLQALGRARIAAYLEPTPDPGRQLLYAAAMERGDARTIVSRVSRAAGAGESGGIGPGDTADAGDTVTPSSASGPGAVSAPNLLQGRDTDSEFQALVADWHVDTVAAIRSAERDLTREDADWRARISPPPPSDADEEEHFVPPPPPPLPRLSPTAIGAIVIIALAIFVLSAGAWLGLGEDLTFLAGIGGILLGAGMLVMKLRAQPDDEDDDGAIL